MSDHEASEQARWDKRYDCGEPQTPKPAIVLRENLHLLPPSGSALEVACGLGGNALCLAEHGLETSAWDLSSVAIAKLAALAAERQLNIEGSARDIVTQPPSPNSFDVIAVSHFLDRRLIPYLRAALRPKGLLFYQTFTRAKIGNAGPENPDYLLMDNELLYLFLPMRILVYREEQSVGDVKRGERDVAMLVAQQRG